MKALDGWYRLGVFLTTVWAAGVALAATYEYAKVSQGDSPIFRFVVLRDANTNTQFGGLSASEIKELGELALKKSRSSEAEPGDAEQAKLYLSARPQPFVRYGRLVFRILAPVVGFWLLFFGIRWVARGFPAHT